MPVIGVAKFERFFRLAASIDVDKDDLKRYQDFVYQKLYDVLLIGQAHVKANHRDVLEPWDLPITKGLQERIHEFRDIDAEIDLAPILTYLAARPPLDVVLSEEAEARLVPIVGGVSLALARTFKIADPGVKNPTTNDWDRATRIFVLLLCAGRPRSWRPPMPELQDAYSGCGNVSRCQVSQHHPRGMRSSSALAGPLHSSELSG